MIIVILGSDNVNKCIEIFLAIFPLSISFETKSTRKIPQGGLSILLLNVFQVSSGKSIQVLNLILHLTIVDNQLYVSSTSYLTKGCSHMYLTVTCNFKMCCRIEKKLFY